MINLGKQIIIQRGESFGLGLILTKECNGREVPYFTSRKLNNPYLLLQVRNTETYEKDKGSIYNYWLPTNHLDSHNCCVPFCNGKPMLKPEEVNTPGLMYYKSEQGPSVLYVYVNDEEKEWQYTGAKFNFNTRDTSRFRQGTWWYELRLVDGTPMVKYLRSLYESLTSEKLNEYQETEYTQYGNSPKWLYDNICIFDQSYKNKITYSRPLANYQTVDKILLPQKFIVR